jgi:hypothetical protein
MCLPNESAWVFWFRRYAQTFRFTVLLIENKMIMLSSPSAWLVETLALSQQLWRLEGKNLQCHTSQTTLLSTMKRAHRSLGHSTWTRSRTAALHSQTPASPLLRFCHHPWSACGFFHIKGLISLCSAYTYLHICLMGYYTSGAEVLP